MGSAAAGGEKQHKPGEPALQYVEAGAVEEPFHLAAGVEAQAARPHEGSECGMVERDQARLVSRFHTMENRNSAKTGHLILPDRVVLYHAFQA